MKKRLLACLLGLTMLGGILTGCNSADPIQTGSSEDSAAGGNSGSFAGGDSQTSVDAGVDTSKFVELTFLVPGDPPQGDYINTVTDEWNKIFKEKLNCSVKLEYLGWTEWETKYSMMLLSGDNLDLVTTGSWMQIWDNAAKGAYMDIGDLLPVCAPDIWAARPQEEWEYAKYNDEIFFVPQTEFSQYTDRGFEYRVDWADKAGLKDGLKDWDDVNVYLKWVKENIPDIIPYELNNNKKELWWDWVHTHTDSYFLEAISTGFTNLFFLKAPDEYTVVCPVFDDDVIIPFGNYFKEWADKGYIREDAMNGAADEEQMFIEGLSALDERHIGNFIGGDYHSFLLKNEEANPDAVTDFMSFCYIKGNLCELDPANDGVALCRSSKNPERALMALNLMYSDKELYQLMQYGIEGVNYTLDENGHRLPQDLEQYPETDYQFFSNLWGCRKDEFEIPSVTENPNKEEFYAAREKIVKPAPLSGFAFDSVPIQAQLAALSDVCTRYMPLLTYGMADDVEKTVNDFRNDLKVAGYDTVLAEIQRQLDEYAANRK